MITKNRDELFEQYDDAAFALLMNEYAEQEGSLLLREFEEKKGEGDVPEMSTALDTKCITLIRQTYKKQRRKEKAKQVLQTVWRVAAVLFITVGICTSLVFSVEALRIPVINFVIEQTDRFTSIIFGQEAETSPTRKQAPSGAPLDAFVPKGYVLSRYSVRPDGLILAIYQNPVGNRIIFRTFALSGTLNLDTENATTDNIEIAGYIGVFVTNETDLKITWFDEEKQVCYLLIANGLEQADFWRMAEHIAQADLG